MIAMQSGLENLLKDIRYSYIYPKTDIISLFGHLGCTSKYFYEDVVQSGDVRYTALRSLLDKEINASFSPCHWFPLWPPVAVKKSLIISESNTKVRLSFLAQSIDKAMQVGPVDSHYLIKGTVDCSDIKQLKTNLNACPVSIGVIQEGLGTPACSNKLAFCTNVSRTQLLMVLAEQNRSYVDSNTERATLCLMSKGGEFTQKKWHTGCRLEDLKKISRLDDSPDNFEVKFCNNDLLDATFCVSGNGTLKVHYKNMLKGKSKYIHICHIAGFFPVKNNRLEKIKVHYFTEYDMRSKRKHWLSNVDSQTGIITRRCIQGITKKGIVTRDEPSDVTMSYTQIPENSPLLQATFGKFLSTYPSFSCIIPNSILRDEPIFPDGPWSSREYLELAWIFYKGGSRHYSVLARNAFLDGIWVKKPGSNVENNLFGAERSGIRLPKRSYWRTHKSDEEYEKVFPLQSLEKVVFGKFDTIMKGLKKTFELDAIQ
jgi:gluconate kinase